MSKPLNREYDDAKVVDNAMCSYCAAEPVRCYRFSNLDGMDYQFICYDCAKEIVRLIVGDDPFVNLALPSSVQTDPPSGDDSEEERLP